MCHVSIYLKYQSQMSRLKINSMQLYAMIYANNNCILYVVFGFFMQLKVKAIRWHFEDQWKMTIKSPAYLFVQSE